MQLALNQMTVPNLEFEAFLDLAAQLDCVGVEARNDLGRPLYDGIAASLAGEKIRSRGLLLLGVSQIYPFNDWDSEREHVVRSLVALAADAGSKTISLIPRNDGTGLGNGERQAKLRLALRSILPILQDADLVGLVEPLGFGRSSLRSKDELVQMISSLGAEANLKIVHDTFHHTIAGGGAIYPECTGIVHISGVVDPKLSLGEMEDEHRILVNSQDRLGNIEQITTFLSAGYAGAFSFESFAPEVHALVEPYAEIRGSMDFISSQIAATAA